MDMNKLMQQAQQMQAEMQKAQEELANETVEASAGGGMVTVKATGALEIVEIKIDPKAIDPDDPELLADMVLAATNEAVRSARSLMEQRLGGLAGGALGILALSRFGRAHAIYGRPGLLGTLSLVAIGVLSVAIAYWRVQGYV